MRSVSTGSRKPVWRNYIPEDWSSTVASDEYTEHVEFYAKLAIELASTEPNYLLELVKEVDHLPPKAFELFVKHLKSDGVSELPEGDRGELWTALQDVIAKHRKFSSANWAIKPAGVDLLDDAASYILPDALHYQNRRLFGENDWDLYDIGEDYKEQSRILSEKQQAAISDMIAKENLESVLEFASNVESPLRVGIALGEVASNDLDSKILPSMLMSKTGSDYPISCGYILGRFKKESWEWINELDIAKWDSAAIGKFLGQLPFSVETWTLLSELLPEKDSAYWSTVSVNPYEAGESIEIAVSKLLENGRPITAIKCLYYAILKDINVHTSLATKALIEAITSKETDHVSNPFDAIEIIRWLQENDNVDIKELEKIEWAYLPILDDYHNAAPVLLSKTMAEDPGYFCDLIRLVFRSKNVEPQEIEKTNDRDPVAENAYRLLRNWKTPPGLSSDGSFDGSKLTSWLERMKESCSESGHLEVALSMFGGLFRFIPKDPDGLWINRDAAEVLNARGAELLREGYQRELFNSRGAHWIDPNGAPERELARKYDLMAKEVEEAEFVRLATTLRQLAETYRRDANRPHPHDPFD